MLQELKDAYGFIFEEELINEINEQHCFLFADLYYMDDPGDIPVSSAFQF